MVVAETLGEETVAERLADRICAFGADQVTDEARRRARIAITDTVAVTLAGMSEKCVRLLRAVSGVAAAPGSALILGTETRTSALDSTLVNGTASHALDFDDFSGVMGGHQSVPLLPALMAASEERKLSGHQLLLAYLVGVETESRLARAVHFHHYDKGWHPTATLGTIGAAAATARLIGLDKAQTANALALAASFAAGIKANFGTMAKPLHVGQCGRNGLLATLLAEQGFTANPAAYEHAQGFFNVFNGQGHYDPAKIFDGWAEPLEIEDRRIAFKRFPCCGSTHPAIAMALVLREEEKVRAEDIAAIEIMPHGRRLRHTDNPAPCSPLEAKFSVQYVVARAFMDGAVRLAHFEGDAYAEPGIRRLLSFTKARPHPQMADDAAKQWGAEVIVTLADGRRLSRRIDDFVEGGKHGMLSDSELWDKFEDCARRALPRDRIASLFERLETIDTAPNMEIVTKLMEVRAASFEHTTRSAVAVTKATDDPAPETHWVP